MQRIKLFQEIPYLESERLVLKRLEDEDASALEELTKDEEVYRYLPTYLFEQQFDDAHEAIANMYGDLFSNKESIILGVYLKDGMPLCGLGELYGFRDDMHKISLGYRLLRRYWGQGIASEAVATMLEYLFTRTDIELVTASTMLDNSASAHVLYKNSFTHTIAAEEDWGFPEPTIADKWFV